MRVRVRARGRARARARVRVRARVRGFAPAEGRVRHTASRVPPRELSRWPRQCAPP